MLHFVVEVRVVLMVQHQCCGVVQDLPNVVLPCICVLAILIWVEPPSLHIHLTT